MVIPPVLKMLPGERRELRILTSGRGLLTDRESLYWLNIYQIPPEVKNSPVGEKVRLALRSQLKVLWRPENIGVLTEESINLLYFSYRHSGIYDDNRSDWNISLSEVNFGNYSITGIVIPPHSARQIFNISPPSKWNNKINFTVINDEGNHWGFTAEVN